MCFRSTDTVKNKLETESFWYFISPCGKKKRHWQNEDAKQLTPCRALCGPASGSAAQITQAKVNSDQKGYD